MQSGKYSWRLYSVDIPVSENCFSVTAKDVEQLSVAVKIVFWITKTSSAENGVATVSQCNVPKGRYDVEIFGKSNSSLVTIKISAKSYLYADENGRFEFSYDTDPIPVGEFKIKVKNEEKTVYLAPAPTQTPTSGSGGGATETTPTPVETPTQTPIQTPIPEQTQTPAPIYTPTPEQTPAQTPEELNETPIPTTEAPKTPEKNETEKTEKKSVRISGFEFAVAVVALATLALLRKR